MFLYNFFLEKRSSSHLKILTFYHELILNCLVCNQCFRVMAHLLPFVNLDWQWCLDSCCSVKYQYLPLDEDSLRILKVANDLFFALARWCCWPAALNEIYWTYLTMNEAYLSSWMWIDLLSYLYLERCLVIELGFGHLVIELLGPLDLILYVCIRYFERFCIWAKWCLLRRAHFHFIAFSEGAQLGPFIIVAGPNQFYNLCCCWSYWSRSPNQTFWFCLASAARQDPNFELLFRQPILYLFSPCSLSAPWPMLRLCSRPSIE